MRETQASKTAGWVAAARTFGEYLPPECQLCRDPYGVRFAEPWLQKLESAFRAQPALGRQFLLRTGAGTSTVFYMQLRTRFIDDALRAFAADGGRQVILLGAGYDSRALRLRAELPDLRFFEVDHPATAAVKRALLPELAQTSVRFVTWDFLNQPMAGLPDALGVQGHDRSRPTLTVWEGVTMYLYLPAIEATVAAVAAYSSAGSPLVFTYFDRERQLGRAPSLRARALSRLVASVGEPLRFGWSRAKLPAWLAQHAFTLQRDVDSAELSQTLFAPEYRHWVTRPGRHFAIATRSS